MSTATHTASTHTALSYSKWDAIGADSDNDDDGADAKRSGPVSAMLESTKSHADKDRDLATQARFAAYHRHVCATDASRARKLMPEAQRDLMARFVAICDKGNEQSNTHRYSEITRFCAQYKDACFDPAFVSGLCELHRCIIESAPVDPKSKEAVPSSREARDSRMMMEAVNTLEACRRFDNVVLLFEMICQPSQSERARKLTELYVRLDFAKRAMLRHLFRENPELLDAADEDDEYEQLINPEAVRAGSSSRKRRAATSNLWGADGSELLILGSAGAVLAVAIGVGAYLWFYHSADSSSL